MLYRGGVSVTVSGELKTSEFLRIDSTKEKHQSGVLMPHGSHLRRVRGASRQRGYRTSVVECGSGQRNNRVCFRCYKLPGFFAAVLVVLDHATITLGMTRYFDMVLFDGLFGSGRYGVDFFFVLSGFIICYAHWDDIASNSINSAPRVIRFAKRRFVRIYPTYWLVFLITIIPLYFITTQFHDDIRSPWYLIGCGDTNPGRRQCDHLGLDIDARGFILRSIRYYNLAPQLGDCAAGGLVRAFCSVFHG